MGESGLNSGVRKMQVRVIRYCRTPQPENPFAWASEPEPPSLLLKVKGDSDPLASSCFLMLLVRR